MDMTSAAPRFLSPIQWLLLFFATLFSLNSMAAVVDVTTATPVALAEQIEWCASDAQLGITEVAAGGCIFKPGTLKDMAHGFSDRAFWLRLTLENPSQAPTERWLRIGNSRLQQVSLFEPAIGGAWRRTDTGILTPLSQRPLVASYPLFPLLLAANETQAVYVRVASETVVDTNPTLWTPSAFAATHHRMDLSRTLSIGGLLVTCLLSVLIFFRQRDAAYLFFAGSLFFATIYDASFVGLLQTYLWPPDLPYDIRLQQAALCLSGLLFIFFVRSFVGDNSRYRTNFIVAYALSVVLVLFFLWAALGDYRTATRLTYFPHMATIMSGIVILIRYWRDGSRAAGYIVLSYGSLIAIMLYRSIIDQLHSSQGSISLALLLIAPIILIGIVAHAEELHAALLQARADSNARMKFLAQMSHEFRTPLNTVLGYVELLLRGSARVSIQEGLAAIKNSSRHLLGMIDDILDHVRGESGQISLRVAPVNWGDFIRSLEQSASMMTLDRGNHFQLILEGDMPEAVDVDELRLQEVLNNLLTNANRYTQGGNITFTCACAVVDDRHRRFTFTVADTGRGIAEEEQKRIFEPFVRGTAGKSSGIDGIGMGLVIAQQLVSLMGGEIRVDSQPGRGSRFFFSIVCELAEAEPQLATVPEHAVALEAHKILVVEDDENNRNLLAMLLADYGFCVVTANSGNDARQFLNGQDVELVVTDQLMPDGDGWSVLKDWSARNIPLILLSAEPPDRPEGLPETLRFASVQLKPFDANTLLNSIGEILSVEWAIPEAEVHDEQMEAVLRPPIELLEPLKAMIEQGAVTDIAEWLEAFSAQHPQYHSYSAKIATANLKLDFDELRRLTA